MQSKGKISTRKMVQAGFLVALSIVSTRFLVIMPTNTLRLSLGEVPLMLAGFLFGPVIGGISGIAADLIGIAINPMGPPHLGFTFSSMMWGVIPGLSLMLAKKTRRDPYDNINIITTIAISIIVISLGLNTYWLSQLFGKGFAIMLPSRMVAAAVNIPLQSVIIITLLKYLKDMVRE